MAGKKGYTSISINQHMQKRLIPGNLVELHKAFKTKFLTEKIGFSKFCSLKPIWCVAAGSSGTHSVCVCTLHQNIILSTNVMKWDFAYQELISKLKCNLNNNACMICDKLMISLCFTLMYILITPSHRQVPNKIFKLNERNI